MLHTVAIRGYRSLREQNGAAVEIGLYKDLGETRVDGLGLLTAPPWDWGKR